MTTGPDNLLEKNLDSKRARPAFCKHFALKSVKQWVKKASMT
jgi:hypothetical protein